MNKSFFLVVFLVLVAGAIMGSFLWLEEKKPSRQTVSINDKTIFVDVADTPDERTLGLSGREGLAEDSGMLFVFRQPTSPSFWMKDMNFSLDIIWIDSNGTVTGIEHSVRPESYPQTFSPDVKVAYVLEVVGGYSNAHNIVVGDKVIIDQ